MEIFNRSNRIYTIKTIDEDIIRLAPNTSCAVDEETANKLIALYPQELMLIGATEQIKETVIEETEEKPKAKTAAKKTRK